MSKRSNTIGHADRFKWIEALAAAPRLNGSAMAVGVVIAICYLNSKSGIAWPSIKTLATKTSRSEATVRNAITCLDDRGFLSIERSIGGSPNRYRLSLPAAVSKVSEPPKGLQGEPPKSLEGCQNADPTNLDPQTLQRFVGKPLKGSEGNPPKVCTLTQEETRNETNEGNPYLGPVPFEPDDFEDTESRFTEFWQVYPKPVAIDLARPAFKEACKRAEPGTIIRGAALYREQRANDARGSVAAIQYTSRPDNWLKSDGWVTAIATDRAAQMAPVNSSVAQYLEHYGNE